jgi:hypothetical protein
MPKNECANSPFSAPAIIVLTDGMDNMSQYGLPDVLAFLIALPFMPSLIGWIVIFVSKARAPKKPESRIHFKDE